MKNERRVAANTVRNDDKTTACDPLVDPSVGRVLTIAYIFKKIQT